MLYAVFFFFKQKTAYEMRISDWSSDVCSSDLPRVDLGAQPVDHRLTLGQGRPVLDRRDGERPARPGRLLGLAGERRQRRLGDPRLGDQPPALEAGVVADRKSTRLNSSH